MNRPITHRRRICYGAQEAFHYPATPKPDKDGSLLTMFRWRSSFTRLHCYACQKRRIYCRLAKHCGQVLIALALGSFALCSTPDAFGVVPAPDGGYAGGNTAEGQSSLLSLTTGIYNTGIGLYSLLSLTDGKFNTGVGAGTLLANTADENTANGAGALLSNTIGEENTANGAFALFSNTEGNQNTADGAFALLSNTTGANNTAIGFQALLNNTGGGGNTAMGASHFVRIPKVLATPPWGIDSLLATTGPRTRRSAFKRSLAGNSGGRNTVLGWAVLANSETAGSENTLVGAGAGGLAQTFGNANVYIGSDVTGSLGESSATRIRNIGSTAIVGGVNVVVEGTGGNGDQRLGYASSSRRYKQEIKPMDKASKTLFALKPVTFRAKENLGPGQRQALWPYC